VAATHAYRWIIETPVRNHYGENDEAISISISISISLGRLAMTYQRVIGNGNGRFEAISMGASPIVGHSPAPCRNGRPGSILSR
jgi:hypothetical protein